VAPAEQVKVVVFAQGRSSRLPGKLHMEIAGEAVLTRTLRLASTISDDVVLVAKMTPEFARYDVARYTDGMSAGGILDRLWNTRFIWGGEATVGRDTLILLGDVVYSSGAVDAAAAPPAPGRPTFFGRSGPNTFIGKKSPEIFALRVDEEGSRVVRRQLTCRTERLVRGGKLWGLREKLFTRTDWRESNDYTDDVDTIEDLRAMQAFAAKTGLD
jgi:hypothetical protein